MSNFKNASPEERLQRLSEIAVQTGHDGVLKMGELLLLPEYLMPGEELVSLVKGKIDNKDWLVVLTDKRFVYIRQGIFGGVTDSAIPLEKVTAVTGRTGFINAAITVDCGETEYTIQAYSNNAVTAFTAIARGTLDAFRSKSAAMADNPAQNTDGDMISKLERLGALRSSGVLTDDEFMTQKAAILAAA
jgi:hypothetical protein